jgi:hypothetical protein
MRRMVERLFLLRECEAEDAEADAVELECVEGRKASAAVLSM